MSKVFGISGYMAYGRRISPFVLAFLACLMWASAAHAQTAPFNSQYDPPPTTPPGCGNGDNGSGGSGVAGDFDPGASGSSESSGGDSGVAGGSESSGGDSGVAGDFDPGASGGSESSGASGGSADENWGCDDTQVLSDTTGGSSDVVSALPTTGGLLAAPVLLGVAIIAAAGIIAVRRKR